MCDHSDSQADRCRFEIVPQAAVNGLGISLSPRWGQLHAKAALDFRTVDDLEAALQFGRVPVLQKQKKKEQSEGKDGETNISRTCYYCNHGGNELTRSGFNLDDASGMLSLARRLPRILH